MSFAYRDILPFTYLSILLTVTGLVTTTTGLFWAKDPDMTLVGLLLTALGIVVSQIIIVWMILKQME